MTTHTSITELMSHLDDLKETLDDGLYLTMVNSLMEIKKTESCFYKVVLQNIYSKSTSDELELIHINDKTTFYLKGIEVPSRDQFRWHRFNHLKYGQIPTMNGKPIYSVGDVICDSFEQYTVNSVIIEITKVD